MMSGLLALAWLVLVLPFAPASAGEMVAYKPGALKAAIANGKTVLVDYKAVW